VLRLGQKHFPYPNSQHSALAKFVPIFFHDRVRQQFFAHGFHHSIDSRLILLIEIHFHVFPDPHIARILEPQRIERVLTHFPCGSRIPGLSET